MATIETNPINTTDENKPAMPNPMDCLDENTKKVYFSKFSNGGVGSYDPSVFVEALRDKDGNLHLYVPARKRMAWFKTDFPNGMVIPDPPVYNMHRVMVVARVYKTADDFKNNQPAAVNMATRLLDDKDPYIVDVCITRAQSRALRDMGYDIPRDAHILKGWTPIKEDTKNTLEENADVMEASVVIKNYTSELEPKLSDSTAMTSSDVKAESAAVPDPSAKSAATTATGADDTDKNPKSVSRKPGRPRKKPAEAVDAPAEATEAPQKEAAAEEGGNASEQHAPVDSEQKSDAATDVAARAQNAFPSIEEAEAYSSRLLGGKTVGEQNDLRIKYFAEKALKADCRDEKLGLAAYLVACQRGISL